MQLAVMCVAIATTATTAIATAVIIAKPVLCINLNTTYSLVSLSTDALISLTFLSALWVAFIVHKLPRLKQTTKERATSKRLTRERPAWAPRSPGAWFFCLCALS
eukprot:COSAG06_NODE_1704_length_8655_cov_104.626812_6_plen_105_part_00